MNFPATSTDLFGLPPTFKGDVQIFHANNQSTINYQPWIKPRGTSMSYIVCIGGGGGGGGGQSAASGTAGGGGGGGACSGISRLLVPTFLLPDTLYVQVGVGGLGGAATVAGGAGTNSYIMMAPLVFTAANSLLSSNTNAPGGGGAGGAAAGTAGTVPTAATIAVEAAIGQFSATVGQVGVAGGLSANGTDVTAWITAGSVAILPLSAGAGGAGATTVNTNGGNQTPGVAVNFNTVNFPATLGSIAAGGTGGTTDARNGSAGVSLMGPFFQSGGAGAGSNVAGVGGDGGRGGIGCGGGGGGKGITGGRGGNGGNGLVAIFSW